MTALTTGRLAQTASGSAGLLVDHVEVATHGNLGTQFGGRVDVEVSYRVHNRGSDVVVPSAEVRVSSQIGGGVTSAPRELEPLRPAASTVVHEHIDGVLPFGSVEAIVTVRAGATSASASASCPVVPWLALVIVVAVLLGMALAWRRARRPSRSHP